MANKGFNRIVGIDKNFVFDFFLGMGIAIGFYLLGKVFGIFAVVGLPTLPSAFVNPALDTFLIYANIFIIYVISASVFETVLFQEFILDFFDSKLKMSFLVSSILSSLAFMLFHLFAYREQLLSLQSLQTNLFIVFLWGMVFCYLRRYTNSILPVIVAHGTLNFIYKFVIELGLITTG